MAQNSIRAAFEPIREVGFAGVGAAYAVLGIPLANPARLLIFTNSTNAEVYISTDGVTNHLRLAANSYKLIDVSANKSLHAGFYFREGLQLWVKRVAGAPTSGTVWIETVFAE